MSRHVSYRGETIDMESMRRENEKVPALGNMGVNAKGDQIRHGVVTRTADQIARDNHRVQSAIVNAGLKGPISKDITEVFVPKVTKTPAKTTKQSKEVELPSGDIVIEDDIDGS